MSFGIVDFLVAALDIPDTPGRDYLHFGSECLYGKLEAHLVVALARATVANGVSALFLGYFHNALGDNGSCERRAQKIFVFIYRARHHRGIDIVLDKLFFQIFDIEF